MAALSANASRQTMDDHKKSKMVIAVGTSAVVFEGSLVAINESTGRAVAATAAAARTFLGVCEGKTGGQGGPATGNTSGTVSIVVAYGHREKLAKAAALTQAYTGCNVGLSDDNTVTTMSGSGTAATKMYVGELVQLDADGDAWVQIRCYSQKDVP